MNESATDIDRIEIHTLWSGLSDPPTRVAKLVIAREGSRFIREQFPDGQTDKLPTDCIHQLIAALSRPLVPELDFALFGVPESVIRRDYDCDWTDDHPAHLVKVTFLSGRFITIRTESQHEFMLPFKVNDSDANTHADLETFDPRLSKAIAGLMPDGYLDKQRLGGFDRMPEAEIEE